ILLAENTVLNQLSGWIMGRTRSIGFGLENIGKFTLRFPRIVAVLVLAMTVYCAAQIPRASVDGDQLRVFAHSGAEYDAYERLWQTFGTLENDIYLLVNSPDLTNPETIETIRALALDLTNNHYITGT